jgi:hypothetical protein
MDDVDFDDLSTLRGLATAIKEGDTTLEEAFPLPGDVAKSKDLPKIGDVVGNSGIKSGTETSPTEPGKAQGGDATGK